MTITSIRTGYLDTNTYIVPVAAACNGAFFVVDPGGNAKDGEYILETLNNVFAKAANAGQKPELTGIVITHGHFDHIGALPFLHDHFPNAPILIHEADAAYLGKESLTLACEDFTALNLVSYVKDTLKDLPMPHADILLKDGDVLPFATGWKVLHTPGHSPGSCCLYYADEAQPVLISGDTLFQGACGRTDLRGGSDIQMRNSLSRLMQLPPDTKVYPGHGPSALLRFC